MRTLFRRKKVDISNALSFKSTEFAGIRDSVLIEVLPDPELAPPAIATIETIVPICVERETQAFKVGDSAAGVVYSLSFEFGNSLFFRFPQ